MFRSFVDPTVSTVLKLLLTVQANSLEVISCLGRVLSALITTLGPELQTGDEGGINGFYESIVRRAVLTRSLCFVSARVSFLTACSILQCHPHPVIQAEAITCMQQMHLFAGMMR